MEGGIEDGRWNFGGGDGRWENSVNGLTLGKRGTVQRSNGKTVH